VLTKDPVSAATALSAIETSSRDAVNQMRGLLGTLRDIEEVDSQSSPESGSASGATGSESVARKPEPGVGDLDDLVAERRQTGLQVDYELVEDPEGAAANLPGSVSLTLYRVAQEALANVTRHSTATSARLAVRVVTDEGRTKAGYAEVEVVDSGRPRVGTSGSGLGQLGMRERAQSLGAVVDIGPRATGGYRVRVRIPLGEKNVRGR
ncbi:MAG TPA: sensor histidine kinase, partial [Phycicoccus sp.]|nr:sensor histidine kinase [Phycicoccus sp.]